VTSIQRLASRLVGSPFLFINTTLPHAQLIGGPADASSRVEIKVATARAAFVFKNALRKCAARQGNLRDFLGKNRRGGDGANSAPFAGDARGRRRRC
jgi:hypothetical protein